jgi:hypothetical protein
MFRQRRHAGIRIEFGELRSTPSQVLVTTRAADFGAVVSVFSFQGRRKVTVMDYPSMAAAQAAIAGPTQAPAEERWWRRWWRRGQP